MSGAEGGGIRVLPGDTLIIERARDYLAGGPAGAPELVSRVFGIGNASPMTAELLVGQRLGAHDEFVRDDAGRWWLRWLHEAAQARRPAPPAPAPQLLSELSYAVVDVETTGGSPEQGHRITEIAVVRVAGGRIVDQFDTLVNPRRPIPSFITRLTGITDAMVRDKEPFVACSARVAAMLEGSVFVAHNVAFDWRFVSSELSLANSQRMEGRRLCTVRLARKLLPQLRRRSLGDVCHLYNIDNAARHRALGDAEATAKVLVRLLDTAGEHGCTTWAELEAFLAPASARPKRRRRPSGLPGVADGEGGA